LVGRWSGRGGDSRGTVGGPSERPRRLWVAKGVGGGGFFRGIVCADILDTLNSFNIDVLGYIGFVIEFYDNLYENSGDGVHGGK
jgi:hypothetical protein